MMDVARELCDKIVSSGAARYIVTDIACRLIDTALAQAKSEMKEKIAQLFDGKVWAYDYREIAARIRALE